jgi:uncharacterized protein (DUF1697 family)
METYFAFLRGINVSGQKMIKMEDLTKALKELHFRNIRTYIQSGNIIFEHDQTDLLLLAEKIAGKISEHFGFEVPVVIRTFTELDDLSKKNPFFLMGNKDLSRLHVTMLAEVPDPDKVIKIEKGPYLPDEFFFSGKEVYLYCPNGYGRTKLTNTFFENKLKTTATTRNWKTIQALQHPTLSHLP